MANPKSGLCFGLFRELLGALRVDVSPHRDAHVTNEVGSMPKPRLAIERGQILGKAISGVPGTGRQKVVDQQRNIQRRMDVEQQMDVIGLPATFEIEQRPAPGSPDSPRTSG